MIFIFKRGGFHKMTVDDLDPKAELLVANYEQSRAQNQTKSINRSHKSRKKIIS